jgi:signal transduction histidine kinase/DNA-binding response OmpR family regulator
MSDAKAAILIVDDHPESLLALQAALEDLNQPIVRAYSGREALRHVLNQDFAVILLDVNMPGMDGFETASMIRQRASSRHTPIIFVTAFGDEMHAMRGYSLGAVDYILAPVIPEVLRTKVAVFVELFAKTRQMERQAESLRRRTAQLQKLAAASLAINSALSMTRMLQTVADTARDIVGVQQAVTIYLTDETSAGAQGGKGPRATAIGSFSDKYSNWRGRDLKLNGVASTMVARLRSTVRLTDAELVENPDWEILHTADHPPVHGGILAAPFTGRDGANLGMIYLSERLDGESFTHEDQAVVVQLVQMASIAIENTAYAQERDANRIKDEFLATLSHELRTPLTAIIGWAKLLRMGKLDGEVAHGLSIIDNNARAQAKLIEDLLDVSRISSGKMKLNLKRSPMGPIVQAAVDAARPDAETKKISLSVEGTDDEMPVFVDPDRIQQVIGNLLGNAVKFTAAGGAVTVRIRCENLPAPGRVTLAVSDTGQGIDVRFLPFVFDRFRQADSSSTRGHGGLGIGLAVVRHIVECHGGTVRAESPGPGRGATFTVELTAAEVAALPSAAADGEAAIPRSLQTVSGLRILLVDDDPDARELIAAMLRRAGAEVTTAASAMEALGRLPIIRPDILVSDIAMPDQDGYGLIRQIRQLPIEDGRELPAIAVSAYARAEDCARALAAGFQSHLAKPVDPAELLARVAYFAAVPQG